MLVEAAAHMQSVAFVEIRAGDYAGAEAALRQGIEELDRLGNRSYRGTTALMLADLLASRGPARRPLSCARTCAKHSTTTTSPTSSGSTRSRGFWTPQVSRERPCPSVRAVNVAATIDMYESKARAFEWHARTLALVGKPLEAREAAAAALRDL